MRAPFANRMTRTQAVLGWCWLPVQMFVLPLLLSLYAAASRDVSTVGVNIVYEAVGLVFVLCVFFRFLRAGFDTLLDRSGRCLLALLTALVADYALSLLTAGILLLAEDGASNPNNAAIMELAEDSGAIWALGIFIAPIVEETLFRGVAFGSLRNKSRALAYIVSTFLFSFFHVWQYVLASADPGMLIYMLQYIPPSLALAWCYERTESIWPPIFLHMLINAISFAALSLV